MSSVLLLFVSSSAEGQPAQSLAAAVDLQSAEVWRDKKICLKEAPKLTTYTQSYREKISEQSIKDEMNF